MIYLDNAATTQPYVQVISKYNTTARKIWMNPSSTLYSSTARSAVEDARSYIAEALGCQSNNIVFTSGSTEAANTILRSGWSHIITTFLEHPCVYNTRPTRSEIHYVKNDSDGRVDLVNLADLLEWCSRHGDSTLVAIMGANNELGTINPVSEIGELTHCYRNAYYFCDTTQLWPHEEINTEGIDFACMSAHKFGGLKGTGFIYAKNPSLLQPLLTGGHQEFGFRAGTENSAGIVAMAEALRLTEEYKADFKISASEIRKQILSHSVYRFNGGSDVVQNIVSMTMPDCDGQKMVAALALDDIYVAAGSACSTGEAKASRVLLATGMSEEEARRTIRISFDGRVRDSDITKLFEKIEYYRGILNDN